MAVAEVPLINGLGLAAILFTLGLAVVLIRRNLIWTLMGIEIMLNAAGLAFIAAGTRWGDPDGQIMFILLLAVAASNVAVGLALVLRFFHEFRSLDADAASRLRR